MVSAAAPGPAEVCLDPAASILLLDMPRRGSRPWQAEHSGRDDRAQVRSAARRLRVRRIDLHGYDVVGAAGYALTAVREAHANGYQFVELLHGAADVTEPVEAGEGRGGIKWELRRMLERGAFDPFCRARHEHALMEGMMRLALRPNPRPRAEEWSSPPEPRHPR
jgi:hypothetical protein